jgi:hypothetical protein
MAVERSLVSKLIIFAVLVVVGMVVWVLVTTVLVPPPKVANTDYNSLLRLPIDPELKVQSVELMAERRVIDAEELAEFDIYIMDEENDARSNNSNEMLIRRLSARVPYDLGYQGDLAATAEAEVQLP